MTSARRPCVYICCGSDCVKRAKKGGELWAVLTEHGEVVEVPCQKICKGPVVGVEIDGIKRLSER